jgi:hypothetical protein
MCSSKVALPAFVRVLFKRSKLSIRRGNPDRVTNNNKKAKITGMVLAIVPNA